MPSGLLGVGDGVNRPAWLGVSPVGKVRGLEPEKRQTSTGVTNPSETRDVRLVKEGITELAGMVTQYTQAVDLGSIAANTTDQVDITTSSGRVAEGDYIVFVGAALDHGLVVQGSIPAPAVDTIRIRVSNLTAAPIDAASTDFYFIVVKAPTT